MESGSADRFSRLADVKVGQLVLAGLGRGLTLGFSRVLPLPSSWSQYNVIILTPLFYEIKVLKALAMAVVSCAPKTQRSLLYLVVNNSTTHVTEATVLNEALPTSTWTPRNPP